MNASPNPAPVAHTASDFRVLLAELLGMTPRAICGASIADDGTPQPTQDSPDCDACAARIAPLGRLLNAYRALWDRYPAAAQVSLLVVGTASVTGLLVGAIAISPRSPLAYISAGVLIVSVLLLRLTPDGDENDESDSES